MGAWVVECGRRAVGRERGEVRASGAPEPITIEGEREGGHADDGDDIEQEEEEEEGDAGDAEQRAERGLPVGDGDEVRDDQALERQIEQAADAGGGERARRRRRA